MPPTTSQSRTAPRRIALTLLVAILAVISLAATSCGGSSSTAIEVSDVGAAPAEDASDDADASAETPSSDDDEEPSSNSESPREARESPIGDLLGVPVSDDDAMEEYFGQLQIEAEAKIAQCMRAEGFEYTPVDRSQFSNFSGADFESREFAETRGFGANPFPVGEMEEQLQDFVDPNQEYTRSLTEGEREAYQMALDGEPPDFDPTSDEDFFFEPAGCRGEAFEEAFSFGKVFDEFGDELQAMEDAFEADPRIVAAYGDWSRCMSDAGFSYASPEDARDSFMAQYQPILSGPDAFEQPDFDPDNPPAEGEVFFPKLKPEVQAQLDGILEEEIAVAVATWDCNEPFRDVEREVQLEAEQKFVDEYGDQIRAALDAPS